MSFDNLVGQLSLVVSLLSLVKRQTPNDEEYYYPFNKSNAILAKK